MGSSKPSDNPFGQYGAMGEFMLKNGGPVTGISFVVAAAFEFVLGIIHKDVDHLCHAGAWMAAGVGFTSMLIRAKRGTDIAAQGFAEQTVTNPNSPDRSADPAINHAIREIKRRESQ